MKRARAGGRSARVDQDQIHTVHSMCVSQSSAPSVTVKPLAIWSGKKRMALEEPAGALVDPAAVLEERPAHEGSAALVDPAAVFESDQRMRGRQQRSKSQQRPAAIDELSDPPLLLGSRTPLGFSPCRFSGGTE